MGPLEPAQWMGNLPLGTLANDPGEKAYLPDLVLESKFLGG